MKVDTYHNFHKSCISVRSRETEDYGRVVAHRPRVTVVGAEFVVQEGGRKRCLESGTKNVHAVVRGEWNENETVLDGEPITYNPFKYAHFVHRETKEPVVEADVALVTSSGVFAEGVSYGV